MVGALAQDKSPEISSQDSRATFSSKVNLVSVPVVVRDKSGKALGNLKKEDFQLFDKGKLQVISKFAIEKADGRAVPIQVTSEDAELDKDAAKAPSGPAPASRFVAYLFDDMHTAFGDLSMSRTAAIKYLAESMKPADRAAIYTTSGLGGIDFTDDRAKLTETLNHIIPRSRAITNPCPDISDYMADLIVNKNDPQAINAAALAAMACGNIVAPTQAQALQMGQSMATATANQILNIAEGDVQVVLSVLRATVQRMGVMPGQRSIVLVSPGFNITIYHRGDESDIMDRAIRANVVINSLDARGLYTIVPGGDASTNTSSLAAAAMKARYDSEAAQVQMDVLGELADGTGGNFFHSNNDLQAGFRKLGETPEFTYVLGFAPQNLKFDGSYHSLKVTAKGTPGVTLQARRGYYAPKHSMSPEDDAKEEIRVALFSREEMSDIPVDLHTQFFKATEKDAKLSVLAHVDLKHIRFKKSEGRNRNTLVVVSAVFDRNGILLDATKKTIEMKFIDAGLEARLASGLSMKTSFNVPPGSYVVRLVVRDSEGQEMAARNGVVEIP